MGQAVNNTVQTRKICARPQRFRDAGGHRQALRDVSPMTEKEWDSLSYEIQRLNYTPVSVRPALINALLTVESLWPSLNTLSMRLFTVLANSK